MTEQLHFHFSLSCIGEGDGNPLQCSCLENPRDGGAWWAAVYGVAQSQTRLKRLSSSSKPIREPMAGRKWTEMVPWLSQKRVSGPSSKAQVRGNCPEATAQRQLSQRPHVALGLLRVELRWSLGPVRELRNPEARVLLCKDSWHDHGGEKGIVSCIQ